MINSPAKVAALVLACCIGAAFASQAQNAHPRKTAAHSIHKKKQTRPMAQVGRRAPNNVWTDPSGGYGTGAGGGGGY